MPVPLNTMGMVLNSIFMSSQSDQLSMYSMSSFTQSSKFSIEFRPLICHNPVIPGFTDNLLNRKTGVLTISSVSESPKIYSLKVQYQCVKPL